MKIVGYEMYVKTLISSKGTLLIFYKVSERIKSELAAG